MALISIQIGNSEWFCQENNSKCIKNYRYFRENSGTYCYSWKPFGELRYIVLDENIKTDISRHYFQWGCHDYTCRAVGISGATVPPSDYGRYLNPISIGGSQIMPPHCVLNGVLRGHFLGINMLQLNKSLRSFMSNLGSFWSPCSTPSERDVWK